MNFVIPEWLRYSCDGCGLCCRRGWVIPASLEDCQRWTSLAADVSASGEKPFLPHRGSFRLGTDQNGQCVFLSPENRCRIHAEMGMSGKSLTCRTYPFILVRCGENIHVSLHFSCPAAAQNRGRPVSGYIPQLRKLLKEIEERDPSRAGVTEETAFDRLHGITWNALGIFESGLDKILAAEHLPLLRRVVAAGEYLDQLEFRYPDLETEAQLPELVENLASRALEEGEECGIRKPALGRGDRVILRMLAGVACDAAAGGLLSPRLRTRIRSRAIRLRLAVQALSGMGGYEVEGRRGSHKDVERVKAYPLADGSDEVLARYLRTRICGRTYFGRELLNLPVLAGARFLLGLYAGSLWLARMVALSRSDGGGSTPQVSAGDIETAVILTDHAFGHIGLQHGGAFHRMLATVNRRRWVRDAALHAAL